MRTMILLQRQSPRCINLVNTCVRGLTVRTKSTSVDRLVEGQTWFDSARPFSAIPGPTGLPLIGTLLQYVGPFKTYDIDHYQAALQSRWEQYGPIMKETIGNGSRTVVRLFDPDYVQTAYYHEGIWPHVVPILESSKKYRESRNMSAGIGNLNGEEWNSMRKAIQAVLMRPQDVSDYLPSVNEVADDVIKAIGDNMDSNGTITHFNNLAGRWNMETAGLVCFGERLGSLTEGIDSHSQRMIKANNDIFQLSTQLLFAPPWNKKLYRELSQLHFEAEDYFYGHGQELTTKTISRIKALSEKGEVSDRYKFLSYLVLNSKLDFKDVSITALTLFADGLNSTVPTLLLAMYCLAKNPEVQQKAFDELHEHIPEDGYITLEVLNKLTYLKACFKEVFRLYPLNVDIKRIMTKDIAIGGYQLPAGSIIELCPFVQSTSATYFDDPMEFRPERWLRGSEQYKNHHPFIVIPFSHGPRMCVGRRIAEQDLYTMMAKLLTKFKVTTTVEDLGLKYQIIQTLDRSVTFTFEPRK